MHFIIINKTQTSKITIDFNQFKMEWKKLKFMNDLINDLRF